jgi:hypothetical protein
MYAEAECLRLFARFSIFFIFVGQISVKKHHVTQTERSKRHGLMLVWKFVDVQHKGSLSVSLLSCALCLTASLADCTYLIRRQDDLMGTLVLEYAVQC